VLDQKALKPLSCALFKAATKFFSMELIAILADYPQSMHPNNSISDTYSNIMSSPEAPHSPQVNQDALNNQENYIEFNEVEKPFKCTEPGCNYATTYRSHLKSHAFQHVNEKPLKCGYPGCNYQTAYSGNLKLHQYKHNKEKPLKCPIDGCGYQTAYQQHLARHKMTHTGQKPFVCRVPGCDYKSSRLDYLKLHTKRKHQNKKSESVHKCPFCVFHSESAYGLDLHMLIHTEDDELLSAPEDILE
jgi:uncharacterized Zn-finger protein